MPFSIGDVLNSWQQGGVFDYLLPFLLIFALVFGILQKSKILGENKGIHIIISIVLGLMALQGGIVQRFFQPLFPRLAMGLGVILTVIILVGLFINDTDKKYWFWGLGALGAVVAIIVISNAFTEYGWYSSASYYSDNAGWIIGGVLLIGVIIAVAASSNK